MSEMSVVVSADMENWIKARLAEGSHVDASDYIRDLIRRDQEAATDEAEWLRGLIAEGLASGRLNRQPEDVLREIMAEYPAKNG